MVRAKQDNVKVAADGNAAQQQLKRRPRVADLVAALHRTRAVDEEDELARHLAVVGVHHHRQRRRREAALGVGVDDGRGAREVRAQEKQDKVLAHGGAVAGKTRSALQAILFRRNPAKNTVKKHMNK